jgi:OPA family glycerol-3-phosphate transporter-like MFS transporter
MIGFYKPAPSIPLLPSEEVDAEYRRLRYRVFIGIFVGYAGYYLVRKNFALAIPFLQEQGMGKGELGLVLSAVSLAYGLSKFIMGSVSDRSNPKYFLPTGLLLSAAIMMLLGFSSLVISGLAVIFFLLFLNGWFQGMGWPACGRTMVHWFSFRERGTKMALWNIAHNIGGGLIGPIFILGMFLFDDWRSCLYFPAFFAILAALAAFYLMKDTPQSCGLPPIETYHKETIKDHDATVVEQELTAREIFFQHVFPNRALWYLAFANAFVYLIRYGVVDWAPTYLSEVKQLSTSQTGWAYFAYEYAGIPGTLICGWMSDAFFKGNRVQTSILYMSGIVIALLIYWLNPQGNPGIDICALILIGFLVYGPVMLIGVQALDMVTKKAAGTAAGLTGLFGYIGGAVIANAVMGYLVEYFGWDAGFILLLSACMLSIVFLWMSGKKELKAKE